MSAHACEEWFWWNGRKRSLVRSTGQKGSTSRCCGTPKARRDTKESWSSTAAGMVSSRNGFCATGPRLFLPREWDCPCATALPLKTTSRTGICVSQLSQLPLSTSRPAAIGEWQKEQVEVTTGGSSHKPARRRPVNQWSLFFVLGSGELRQHPKWLSSLFRTALLILAREGPRKGGLKKSCPKQIWSANRCWQTYPSCGQFKKRKRNLSIDTWNVRTPIDRNDVLRPHRRTALIAKELSRYNINIAAIGETRLAEEGSLTEPDGG